MTSTYSEHKNMINVPIRDPLIRAVHDLLALALRTTYNFHAVITVALLKYKKNMTLLWIKARACVRLDNQVPGLHRF
jgi:hypothetical protein